jgi:hypothetical protein
MYRTFHSAEVICMTIELVKYSTFLFFLFPDGHFNFLHAHYYKPWVTEYCPLKMYLIIYELCSQAVVFLIVWSKIIMKIYRIYEKYVITEND